MNPGTVIADRYTLEKELGRGGMGAVFVAKDKKFGGKVALKIAQAAGLTLDEFRARFAREARIGHRLGRSEGFVRALDWGEIPGSSLYLAMDLVEGAKPLDLTSGSLEERLERFGRAAKLVETAHGLGVVHRDLKPANMLVAANGKIYLADFGLAKSKDVEDEPQTQLTRTGLGMGTPAFMPPEQFEDARSADERADIYALGVMLFVALAGKLPYDGSPTAIMQRQIRVQEGRDTAPRPRTLVPGVSAALDEICARAIALDRNERYATVTQLLDAIGGAIVGAEETHGPEALVTQPTVATPHSAPRVPPTPPAPTPPALQPPSSKPGVRGVAPPVPPVPTPPSSHVRRVAPPPQAPTIPMPPPQGSGPPQPRKRTATEQLIIIVVGAFVLLFGCCTVWGTLQQMFGQQHHGGF